MTDDANYHASQSRDKICTDSPLILTRSTHNLSRRLVDPDALRIMYKLHRRGFIAYLVGGCVRDILLNIRPKDFDVCTNAHPSQIKKMFRNCRLIGRRFRLAHLHFKDNKIIEVSTFRRAPDNLPETGDRRKLVIHSNKYYGSPKEDVRRRDFTINALYYNIADFTIIDYVGGIADLENRLIRIIGDPKERFFEDPVRMLRGIEFAVRLGFDLEDNTYEGIKRCHTEIQYASTARIKEELISILLYGFGFKCFSYFIDTGLFHYLFNLFKPINNCQIESLLALLAKMDALIEKGYAPSEELCLSVLLWPFVDERQKRHNVKILNDFDELLSNMINPFSYNFHLRVHIRHLIKEIQRTVWRMNKGIGNKGEVRLMRKTFFPDAMRLFRWLGECDQVDLNLVNKWEERMNGLPKSNKKRYRYKDKYWKIRRRKRPPK